jgi:hypothetical protein
MAIVPIPRLPCVGCAELAKRVEELEKLTAHLRPRLQNDRAMREEQRRKAAAGIYDPDLE